jgi:hypothetical protein
LISATLGRCGVNDLDAILAAGTGLPLEVVECGRSGPALVMVDYHDALVLGSALLPA